MLTNCTILVIGSTLPGLLVLAWVYFRDQLREPPHVVLVTMLLGAVAVLPILIIQLVGAWLLGIDWADGPETLTDALLLAFVLAALVEEAFKFLVLWLYSARHSAFDEPFDGIVYGLAASVGFAIIENVLYIFGGMLEGGGAGGLQVAALRAVTPIHETCGIVMGASIGIAVFRRKPVWVVIGLLLAMLMHGTYNAFLFAAELPGVMGSEFGEAALIAWALLTTVVSIAAAVLLVNRMRAGQRPVETGQPLSAPPVRGGLLTTGSVVFSILGTLVFTIGLSLGAVVPADAVEAAELAVGLAICCSVPSWLLGCLLGLLGLFLGTRRSEAALGIGLGLIPCLLVAILALVGILGVAA